MSPFYTRPNIPFPILYSFIISLYRLSPRALVTPTHILHDMPYCARVISHPKFILRGIANNELFQKASESIPEGIDWWLVYLDHDDIFASRATGDKTHQSLKEEFEKYNGREIAIGFDKDFSPFEYSDRYDDNVVIAGTFGQE